ncbi:GGDEF domain-containing protein [Ensifer sp. 4252]|uniref:GGDEF domain-containing protein n=1 Tax=Ensifer sp. 4252 TaxID=3373915 RepID=UPI003D24326D
MKSLEQGLDRRAIIWIMNWTFSGTAGCTAVALLITYYYIAPFGGEVMATSMRLALFIPLLLAIPLFAFIGIKLQQLARANDLLTLASRYDGLTGCLNRAAFTSDVTAFFAEQDRKPFPATSALMVLDADHFKRINDHHGHLAGDQALVAIATEMRTAVGDSGLIGRLGGEEFAVFVPYASPETIGAMAERIRLAVAERGQAIAPGADPVTVSVGVALFTFPAHYEDIFKIADDQLYLAKNTGRNRVCLIEYARLPGGIRAMAAQLREGISGAFTDVFGNGGDDLGEEPSRVAGR